MRCSALYQWGGRLAEDDSPHRSAAATTRSAPKYYGAERSILAQGIFVAANRSQCGSMIYTFYMFYTAKNKSET